MSTAIWKTRVDPRERRATLLAMPDFGRVVQRPSRPGPVIDFSPEIRDRQRYLWSFYGKAFETVEEAERIRGRINVAAKHMPLREAINQFRSPRSQKDSVWEMCEEFLAEAPMIGSERTHESYTPRTIKHYRAVLRRARSGFQDMGMREFFQKKNLARFRVWFSEPKEKGGRGLRSETEMANCIIALRAMVRWYQLDHPAFTVAWPSVSTKITIAKRDKKASRNREDRRGGLKLKLGDVVRIISLIPEPKQPIFWILFFTQCRLTEARAVLGCDYHDGRIYIERSAAGPGSNDEIIDKTKNDQDGSYLMPDFVQDLVARHCTHVRFSGGEKTPLFRNPHPQATGHIWGEDALRQMWLRATKVSGLPWVPLYRATKHTQVSALREAGISIDDIVEQCRWTSAEMMENYDRAKDERRDAVVVKLGELAQKALGTQAVNKLKEDQTDGIK